MTIRITELMMAAGEIDVREKIPIRPRHFSIDAPTTIFSGTEQTLLEYEKDYISYYKKEIEQMDDVEKVVWCANDMLESMSDLIELLDNSFSILIPGPIRIATEMQACNSVFESLHVQNKWPKGEITHAFHFAGSSSLEVLKKLISWFLHKYHFVIGFAKLNKQDSFNWILKPRPVEAVREADIEFMKEITTIAPDESWTMGKVLAEFERLRSGIDNEAQILKDKAQKTVSPIIAKIPEEVDPSEPLSKPMFIKEIEIALNTDRRSIDPMLLVRNSKVSKKAQVRLNYVVPNFREKLI